MKETEVGKEVKREKTMIDGHLYCHRSSLLHCIIWLMQSHVQLKGKASLHGMPSNNDESRACDLTDLSSSNDIKSRQRAAGTRRTRLACMRG